MARYPVAWVHSVVDWECLDAQPRHDNQEYAVCGDCTDHVCCHGFPRTVHCLVLLLPHGEVSSALGWVSSVPCVPASPHSCDGVWQLYVAMQLTCGQAGLVVGSKHGCRAAPCSPKEGGAECLAGRRPLEHPWQLFFQESALQHCPTCDGEPG